MLTRETVVPLPAEDISPWTESNQDGIYLFVVLSTLVTYDASESLSSIPIASFALAETT